MLPIIQIIGLGLALWLASCAEVTPPPTTRIEGNGQMLPPPAGYVDFCRRHPTELDCQQ